MMHFLSRVAAVARASSVFALVTAYATEATYGKLFIRDKNERLRYFAANVGKWCKRALNVMNVKVEVFGFKPELFINHNYLLVGNHLSYLDIFVTSSTLPVLFVTSTDMQETPGLGQMAEMGGSIFVERRSRVKVSKDLGTMAQTLRDGHNVIIYPEGTSTPGDSVLPFKKSLLMAAVEAGKDVMPVVIRYTHMNGERLTLETRENVCWYGEVPFGAHFMRFAKIKSLKAEIHFLDPITVTQESDRHILAQKTYEQISAVYGNPFGAPRPPA